MFLIDIPFKGCQDRSNRASIVRVGSYFPCGVNDLACTVHKKENFELLCELEFYAKKL
jgi:hypothetical protein